MSVNIYLAHRNSTRFFEQQTILIRQFFKSKNPIQIYGYVDGSNAEIKKNIANAWESLGVIPIDIPQKIQNIDRNTANASVSFGLAFQYVYETYILQTDNVCICMENDIMPLNELNIDTVVGDYEIVGEIRFNAQFLPQRLLMFWLGFIIFNNPKMTDRKMWRAESKPVISRNNGNTYEIDCGGQSYYWITEKQRNIRQIKTKGDENYNAYFSSYCTPHNITHDKHILPSILQKNYYPNYRVLIYEEDWFVHLEQMGKKQDVQKQQWWNMCYANIIAQ